MAKGKKSERPLEGDVDGRAASDDARDFAPCGGCTCFALRRAARVMSQHYARHLRPTGLRGTQFTLLANLVAAGPMPMNRMARRLDVERTTLTRNLKPLLAKGWITITEDEDRRVHMVSITAKGRAAARAALPAWHKAQATARAKLADLRLERLLISA
jgi:DNA-binding MarR family transcriptional regulator